jgi:hypothetical protein
VVATVRDRLAVRNRKTKKFDIERFNLNNLNEAEVKGEDGVEISNNFAAVENLGHEWLRIELGKL